MGEAPPILLSPLPPSPSSPQKTDQASELPPLFNRKIEFHPSRKQSNGFGNSGGDKGGFLIETLNPENNSGLNKNLSCGSESRVVKAESVERNGFDSELLSLRITFRRIGAGLQNLGNTCFLNSVLQCLTYTEPLAAYLQSGKHQTYCQASGFCALCAIERHVSRALNSSGRIVAPKDLVSHLRCISRNFRNARQEDAHEYMVNLLESMHKCCLPSGVPSESPSAYERSLVHKIFGGRLRSQVKCLQCSYGSNKFDPFLDLSLEILKADSVYKALTHFIAKEHLDGGERQYQCQQCKQKVKALKQLTIYKPPHVLAIHLKRFGSHVQGQKINKKVDFAPTFDLKPFVTGPYDGDLKYTLYGVLVHAGYSTHSGHYYCYVRTSSGIWYSLDDNQVIQVGERKVLEQKAYMLFYVRDQKNIIPKKPADAVLKETETNFEVLRGSMQNGPIQRKTNGSVSHTSNQGDARSASASNEGLVKIPAGPNVPKADQARYLDVNAKNSPSLRDSSLANLNASTSNGGMVKIPADTKGLKADYPTSLDVNKSLSSKEPFIANLNVGEKGAASMYKASDRNDLTAVNGSISTVTLENGDQTIINASVAELSQLNIPQFIAKEDRCDPCTRITSCNGHAGVEKVGTHAVNTLIDSNIIGTVEKPSISMKTQKVEISKLCGSSIHGAADVGKKPELPTTLEILPQKKSADKTSRLTVKKKLFKSPIMKMHLSTNIIFRTAFGLRKKKMKHRGSSFNSVNKKCGQEHLADMNLNESGLGPSTSENNSTRSNNKKRKVHKSGGKNVTVTADSMIIIDELKERVHANDHLVSTEKQHVYYKSEIAAPAWSADKRKEVNPNVLTAVSEETTVAKWDGVQVPQTTLSKSDKLESISIGYIGDEWDESYDMGKRKKVRMNKIDFDGQNHFQEIANRKAKYHPRPKPFKA